MTGKSDATATEWIDPDDAPEWTDELFDRAEHRIGNRVIKPATGTLTKASIPPGPPGKGGRPPLFNLPKKQVTLRLDPEVLSHFKADGPGWQTRINEALRKAAGL